MVLLTLVYDESIEDIVDDLNDTRQYLKNRNICIGISESIENKTHFIKIYCDKEQVKEKELEIFNLYIGNIIYHVVINQFEKKQLTKFLNDTYFFLKEDEIIEARNLIMKELRNESSVTDEFSVYCMNKKNSIIDSIAKCISENKEVNINGYVTFRMKEVSYDIKSIVDKVIERYMVEKEYDEFIKLLKYFVDIQDSKIDELHIIVERNGNLLFRDSSGNDIQDKILNDFESSNLAAGINLDDMLISGLITNAPKKIVIHCAENCHNKELINTIKNVFVDKVYFSQELGIK